MTKIKLDGLRWNNIDLSRGVSEEHKALVAKRHPAPVKVKTEGAPEGGFTCDLYVAQYNFVDAEPRPTYTAYEDEPAEHVPAPPAMLPGQAIKENAGPFSGAVPYMSVTGANLKELVEEAEGMEGEDAVMFSALSFDGDFLESFVRNGSTYRAQGESELLGVTEDGVASYKWTGWGVTYYTGLFRPALFSQYPPLSMAQQVTVADGNAFVIDYTKTEMYYEIDKEGNVHLLHGKVH